MASRTIVPRPPTLIRPKRRKGVLQVMISGVILRITITFSGSLGINLAAPDAIAVLVDGGVPGVARAEGRRG